MWAYLHKKIKHQIPYIVHTRTLSRTCQWGCPTELNRTSTRHAMQRIRVHMNCPYITIHFYTYSKINIIYTYMNNHNHLYVGTLVCLYLKMCESVDAYVRANVRACVCACVRAWNNTVCGLSLLKHKDRRLRNCVIIDCVHANVHPSYLIFVESKCKDRYRWKRCVCGLFVFLNFLMF